MIGGVFGAWLPFFLFLVGFALRVVQWGLIARVRVWAGLGSLIFQFMMMREPEE